MPERRGLGRARQSHIEAIMSDGSHHYFTPQVLDVLLGSNRVTKFRRSSGWVTVGIHPVRTHSRREASHTYNGPERRSTN